MRESEPTGERLKMLRSDWGISYSFRWRTHRKIFRWRSREDVMMNVFGKERFESVLFGLSAWPAGLFYSVN
jgi:hypothetical protein